MSYKFGDIKEYVDDNGCLPSIFEQNDKHTMRIGCGAVKFENDEEIDASKVNFSDPEVLEQVLGDLIDLGVLK